MNKTRYIIEFEDEPIMEEDGLKFYKCVQAPWWSVSDRIISRLAQAPKETIHCRDCKRNIDNGGEYPDGRTRCPIQEHYALLDEGFCHLGERK